MIDYFLSYDDEDQTLGVYFVKCKADLESFLVNQQHQHNLRLINSRLGTSAYLQTIFSIPNPSPFLFIVYGHGNRKSISGKYGEYINSGVNTTLFSSCLFYSTACLCGNDLADDLINDGAHAFIGYRTEVYSLKEEYEDVSIRCDNSGLFAFISENITAAQAVEKMKSYYTFHIEKIHNNFDPIRAGLLTLARESLTLKGNPDISFADLFYD